MARLLADIHDPWVLGFLVLLAGVLIILGFVLGVFWYRWKTAPPPISKSAMSLREYLLTEYPPGPRPELRFKPVDGVSVEEWEWLGKNGFAYETAQGWRLNEWGPAGGIALSEVEAMSMGKPPTVVH